MEYTTETTKETTMKKRNHLTIALFLNMVIVSLYSAYIELSNKNHEARSPFQH